MTIPAAEKIIEQNYKNIGVLATQATVNSRSYKQRIGRFSDDILVTECTATQLATMIEQAIIQYLGSVDKNSWKQLLEVPISEIFSAVFLEEIRAYLLQFQEVFRQCDAIVIGCTHYSWVVDIFEEVFQKPIIDPSYESSVKLGKVYET